MLAVIVLGVLAVADWVDATDAQLSFWDAHSSTVKPGPENEAQAVNWCPQAAAAAEARSSNSSPRTLNCDPDLPTEGQAPPLEETKMKKVSICVMICVMLTVLEPEPLPDPELLPDPDDEVVAAATEEEAVVVPPALIPDEALPPPPLPTFFKADEVVDFAAAVVVRWFEPRVRVKVCLFDTDEVDPAVDEEATEVLSLPGLI